MTVTPEMIEAALAALEPRVSVFVPRQPLARAYLAMRALDPEVERLRQALTHARVLLQQHDFSTPMIDAVLDDDLLADANSYYSQTQLDEIALASIPEDGEVA